MAHSPWVRSTSDAGISRVRVMTIPSREGVMSADQFLAYIDGHNRVVLGSGTWEELIECCNVFQGGSFSPPRWREASPQPGCPRAPSPRRPTRPPTAPPRPD